MSFLVPLVFFLSFSFHGISHGDGVDLLSVEVVGSVFCDTCLRHDFSKLSYFIPGASVLVECGPLSPSPGFMGEAETDKHGEFTVRLPISIKPTETWIKNCTAKLIRSTDIDCSDASAWSSSSTILKSRTNDLLTFSVGSLTFKPSQEPITCKDLEPKNTTGNWVQTPPFFPRITGLPLKPPRFPFPFIPLPFPSLPPLPPLPSLPPFPLKPIPTLPTLPTTLPFPQLPPFPGIPNTPSIKPSP